MALLNCDAWQAALVREMAKLRGSVVDEIARLADEESDDWPGKGPIDDE